MFEVRTVKDTEKLKERSSQIENWSKEQSSLFNTVIDSVNENIVDIKYIADFVDKLSGKIEDRHMTEEQKLSFLHLANECVKHISLHK